MQIEKVLVNPRPPGRCPQATSGILILPLMGEAMLHMGPSPRARPRRIWSQWDGAGLLSATQPTQGITGIFNP